MFVLNICYHCYQLQLEEKLFRHQTNLGLPLGGEVSLAGWCPFVQESGPGIQSHPWKRIEDQTEKVHALEF